MAQYLRFQSSLRLWASGPRMGIFYAASEMSNAQKLESYTVARLDDVLKWFNDNLTVPDLPAASWSSVFWFRPEARRFITRIWDLVEILHDNEVYIHVLHTRCPGEVCYEDEFQIAAAPGRSRR